MQIKETKRETNAELYVYDVNDHISIFQDNFFDIITTFDVVEHLESPYRTLKKIYLISKINGKILITTPNINAIDKLIRKKKWYRFQDKTHLYLFRPDSSKLLIERSGFKIEKIETKFHSLPKILQRLANNTNLGGQIWIIASK